MTSSQAPADSAIGECCEDLPSRRVIEGARNTLRAMLNHARREELISRNVAELVSLLKSRKTLRRRSSWTVDEARRFLEPAHRDNDPLYGLWMLILVLGLGAARASAWSTMTTPLTRKQRNSGWNGSSAGSVATH